MKYQPLKLNFKEFPKKEIKKRSEEFYNMIKTRRSVRNFQVSKIDNEIIKNAKLKGIKQISLSVAPENFARHI